MAGSSSFAFLLLCSVFIFPNSVQTQPTNFIFNGFNGSESKLTRKGSTIVRPSGALKLTNSSKNIIGHAFFSEPIQIQNKSSFSFSTSFVFAILTPKSGRGGHGLAFTLSPSKEFPGAEPGHYMGIFNETNDGLNSNHIVAVEFDTVNGFNRDSDEEGNHVGININSMESNVTEPAAYHNQTKEDMKLESGDPIHAWVEYDGKLLNVTIAPLKSEKKPSKPLISFAVDLAPIVDETMYVGFSAATGEKSSSHFILGWSFSTNGPAAELNVSQLPVAPPQGNDGSSSYDPQVIGLIVALSFVTVLLLGILVYFICYRRKKGKSEDLEDWELDCPHRFRYKDLHVATKGFKESEIIGVGGFGAVYKGVLPTTGTEVAVKKINRNSIQGLREFAAEIESLGRLRHKNLVNLQGWSPELNISMLPPAPGGDSSSSKSMKPPIIALISALAAVTALLLVSLISQTLYRRLREYENLEVWELDCPHRFKYNDLYKATKGFKDSELIGVGGFGKVYKGVLPGTGAEVAVKRIARNSVQGMREFAAEIESLGRLRHKNLINLQGWCKRKNDLLLVYDYIPNGSLDTLLFKRRNNLIIWT
ncbi:hypothetical protein COLO4_14484 [Corchorus olitorius]|uniref:non-specific serine/threonine protein kinase n=1 Tax=Corchorus olitorius TaxID=93759 RepID=A0A1R3JS00_9ROSI|nr:hypothetical protein COLO4_14484 [Corchorus olitorius]